MKTAGQTQPTVASFDQNFRRMVPFIKVSIFLYASTFPRFEALQIPQDYDQQFILSLIFS